MLVAVVVVVQDKSLYLKPHCMKIFDWGQEDYVIQFTLTLKMTTAQVLERSVTVNNNSPIQDYALPDDQSQPTFEMTPGFKPFTVLPYEELLTRSE